MKDNRSSTDQEYCLTWEGIAIPFQCSDRHQDIYFSLLLRSYLAKTLTKFPAFSRSFPVQHRLVYHPSLIFSDEEESHLWECVI